MSLVDQRAQLENRRDMLISLWNQRKISLSEFASGIEILALSIHMLDNAIEIISKNRNNTKISIGQNGDE